MKPIAHGIAGVTIGLGVGTLTSNWALGLYTAATHILVDVDHIVDHLCSSPKPFCLKTFFSEANSIDWKHVVFVLHAYEWLAVILLVGWNLQDPLVFALATGLGTHLLLDQIGNRRNRIATIVPGFYFITYRFWHGFRRDQLIFTRASHPGTPLEQPSLQS